MDINDLRSIATVLAFLTFIGIVWWAFGKGARRGFDEAANLPFADDGVKKEEEKEKKKKKTNKKKGK